MFRQNKSDLLDTGVVEAAIAMLPGKSPHSTFSVFEFTSHTVLHLIFLICQKKLGKIKFKWWNSAKKVNYDNSCKTFNKQSIIFVKTYNFVLLSNTSHLRTHGRGNVIWFLCLSVI